MFESLKITTLQRLAVSEGHHFLYFMSQEGFFCY